MEIHTGIPVCPGFALGEVYLLETKERSVPERAITAAEADGEVERLTHAMGAALAELAALREAAGVGSEIGSIFASHDMVLQDPALNAEIEGLVRTRLVSAEFAVASVFDQVAARFEAIEDAYFAQRGQDIRDIERRLLRVLLGDRQEELIRSDRENVVCAHDLTPSQTVSMDRARVRGLVTDVGGPTSHTAIVARSMGLPAVVGVGDITSRVQDGARIIVDGNRGVVIVDPDEAQMKRYRKSAVAFARYRAELELVRDYPSETRDGHVIRLMGNIEVANDVTEVIEQGGDGIGLFRTEFLYRDGRPAPTEEDHFRAYVHALRQLAGRPLTIRTFDFGADKVTPDAAAASEPNPFLGSRSLRLCLERPGLFVPQLRAILRASSYGSVRCLFPMVSGLSELRRARALLDRARTSLRGEGHLVSDRVPVGVMIEIPSAALVADLLVQEVDFLSIGSNDLVQYTLAVDRVNERVAHLYQPAHPALLRLISYVVKAGSEAGVPVSLCGEIAGDVLFTILLVGMGLREFSVPARAIPEVKQVVRSLTVEQSREAAAWCTEATDTEEVLSRLREAMSDLLPHLSFGGSQH